MDGTGRARARIPAAEHQARNARQNDGPHAHGAGLQRDVQRAVAQPPGAQSRGGGLNGDQLRVGGGILRGFAPVAAARDDRAIVDDDRAHRHFVKQRRAARLPQRFQHEKLIGAKLLFHETFFFLGTFQDCIRARISRIINIFPFWKNRKQGPRLFLNRWRRAYKPRARFASLCKERVGCHACFGRRYLSRLALLRCS